MQEGELRGFEPYDPPAISTEGRVDLRDQLAFTIDPETAKDFDDALTVTEDRAYVHIADVSYFVPAGSPLDRGAQERAFSVYVPGLVSPMLPPELSEELCSLRPHTDRLCLTVEVPLKGGLPAGEPKFYRSVIRSRERLTYSRAEAILRGRERADAELTEALHRAERLATALRDRRFARGALRIESGEVVFAFDGKGGVERAWRETEPHAHMLVEELMILANELVAGLLAGRRRDALYRVHEPPDPQSVQLMLARLADLGVPTPPAPKQLSSTDAAAIAGAASEAVTGYIKSSGRGRDAFPPLVLQALKQAHYDPQQPGPHGSREHRVLPLHVADPPLSGPGRASRAPARARRLGRAAPRGAPRSRRERVGPRAPRLAARVPGRRDLPRLAPRAAPLRARLGSDLRRRDHRRDRVGPVRPLRRGLRGLRARAPPSGRLLRAERARDGARRSARRAHVPPGRSDRRPRPGHPPRRRQGRAGAGRGPRDARGAPASEAAAAALAVSLGPWPRS